MYFCNTQCKALKTDYIQICTILCSFVLLGGVFMVAFLQNILGAWLTPFAKKLLATWLERQYPAPKVKLSNWNGPCRVRNSTHFCRKNLVHHAVVLTQHTCWHLQNRFAAYVTSVWKAGLKQEGYRAKLGVVPLQHFAALNRVQMSLVFLNHSVC